ncbi:hypothetical protein M9Y10_007834 [Tritrichomonas musculus]|uniref:Ubiquitin-like domain-containing protein n=1 Tax=Tritrichomonas musculus TaxID=1915356 RepID=A0ABR2J2T5_9EUKA
MWINFTCHQQKFSLELTGEETIEDVENILNESYDLGSNHLYFLNQKFLLQELYYTPLKEVPDIKGHDFLEIQIVRQSDIFDEYSTIPPNKKQSTAISIGQSNNSSRIRSQKVRLPRIKRESSSPRFIQSSQDVKSRNSSLTPSQHGQKVRFPQINMNSSSPRNHYSNEIERDIEQNITNKQNIQNIQNIQQQQQQQLQNLQQNIQPPNNANNDQQQDNQQQNTQPQNNTTNNTQNNAQNNNRQQNIQPPNLRRYSVQHQRGQQNMQQQQAARRQSIQRQPSFQQKQHQPARNSMKPQISRPRQPQQAQNAALHKSQTLTHVQMTPPATPTIRKSQTLGSAQMPRLSQTRDGRRQSLAPNQSAANKQIQITKKKK